MQPFGQRQRKIAGDDNKKSFLKDAHPVQRTLLAKGKRPNKLLGISLWSATKKSHAAGLKRLQSDKAQGGLFPGGL